MLSDVSKGIKVEHFTKIYGKGSSICEACSDVDFVALPGKVTGILGPNGAGKSTLLKAICGIHYGTSGSVEVCGLSDAMEIRRLTGYVPESPRLEKWMTVREAVTQEAILHCASDVREIVSLVDNALKIAELHDVADKKISTLSKGYTQRTSLARALGFNPSVLVMDEYSGGLDPAQIVKIRKAIKKLAEKKTVVLSTHHIEDAVSICDSIYIMSRGRIAAHGSVDEILSMTKKKNLEQAFLFLTEGED